MSSELLKQIATCVEAGKVNKASPYPPAMAGQDGADEITCQALAAGIPVSDILEQGLMAGMHKVGVAFRENIIFVPQVLMSAGAMKAAMAHLKPHFASGNSKRKGTLIIGTVAGDIHDIGKNLVAMMAEGNGYEVIDLGVDVKPESIIAESKKHPDGVIGLSCLLTTTMPSMEITVKAIKNDDPLRVVCVGGAPIHQEFCDQIGADSYMPDPQGAVEFLNSIH